MIKGVANVSKNPLQRSKMWLPGSMYVKANLMNNIGKCQAEWMWAIVVHQQKCEKSKASVTGVPSAKATFGPVSTGVSQGLHSDIPTWWRSGPMLLISSAIKNMRHWGDPEVHGRMWLHQDRTLGITIVRWLLRDEQRHTDGHPHAEMIDRPEEGGRTDKDPEARAPPLNQYLVRTPPCSP